MKEYHIPAETHIGRVHLQVSSLDRSLVFYRDLLGFRQASGNGGTALLSATGQAPYHILLTEQLGARRKPPRTTGLYHVAIRFPSRQALARTFHHLVAHDWPFQGFADHLVSEALYLADPDGNGLELYVDRPQGQWARHKGQIEMATDPLDVEGLLSEADNETIPWTGVHPSTDVGHVHLHVSDLAQAEAFYSGLLGLNVTQRGYPGALFLSAGDYHHHLGVNVWAGVGAPSPPSDAVGLRSFALKLPNEKTMCALHRRVQESGLGAGDPHEYKGANGILIHDPDGNSVELLVMKKQSSSSNEGVR